MLHLYLGEKVVFFLSLTSLFLIIHQELRVLLCNIFISEKNTLRCVAQVVACASQVMVGWGDHCLFILAKMTCNIPIREDSQLISTSDLYISERYSLSLEWEQNISFFLSKYRSVSQLTLFPLWRLWVWSTESLL